MPTPVYEVIDLDNTPLAFTREPGADKYKGFVPATGNRLLHPQHPTVLAREELEIAARSAEFWQSVDTMPAPVGISSDGSF